MITTDRMAAVDRNAAALGVPQKQLMESSGNAVARVVRTVAPVDASITVVGGRGNNGGDAFVAARYLEEYDVSVVLVGRPATITTEITRDNWEALVAAEVSTQEVRDSADLELGSPDVVVDGILGTGLTGEPREPERTVIETINRTDATVIAVDVPSGMNADTAAGEVAVNADHVVTFHDQKPGLVDHENVTVADIGIPEAAELFVGPGDLLSLQRNPASHKGDHGKIHVIGGGPYTGAPALAGQAALRGGADLAYVAAPDAVAREIQGFSEDLIVEPFDGKRLEPRHVAGLLTNAATRDVVIFGPGLGDAPETLEATREFLREFDGHAVVDADALAVVPEVTTSATLVCTPHQGELVEMGGSTTNEWRDRCELVSEFAETLGHTLLVKGRYDIITDGDTTRVNRTGNPGMTVGGTGDVLAGVTGALLATQPPRQAGAIGAYANGLAGDMVVDTAGYGLLASDLLPQIPQALWGGTDD